ncbi:MAG: hypothetical protein ACYTHM_08970 [Planctomycetota bacterium]|jgi:hypothetical protein
MRTFWITALVGILLLFVVNHIERGHRSKRGAQDRSQTVQGPVIDVLGEQATGDHHRIAVDEIRFSPPESLPVVRFDDLRKWNPDPVKGNPPPQPVNALDGKRVASIGFMAIQEKADRVKVFFLVRDIHQGSQAWKRRHTAKPTERIRVEMKDEVSVVHKKPVLVVGRFILHPVPEGDLFYHIEGEKVEPAGWRTPAPSKKSLGRLPVFDFFWLEELEVQESRGQAFRFPEALQALVGKRVFVQGYIVGREKEPRELFMVGKELWDGCCGDTPPTYFNSVLMIPE